MIQVFRLTEPGSLARAVFDYVVEHKMHGNTAVVIMQETKEGLEKYSIVRQVVSKEDAAAAFSVRQHDSQGVVDVEPSQLFKFSPTSRDLVSLKGKI